MDMRLKELTRVRIKYKKNVINKILYKRKT